MSVRHFAETDTLLTELRDSPVAEIRDLDENTILGLDAGGDLCAITVEHASRAAGAPAVSYERVAA